MMVRSTPDSEVLRGVSSWCVKEGGYFVLVSFLVGIEYFFIDHVGGLNWI